MNAAVYTTSVLTLLSCAGPNEPPDVIAPEAPTWFPTPAPHTEPDTGPPEPPFLELCDLSDAPDATPQRTVDAQALLSSTVSGEPLLMMGMSVAVVPDADGPGRLVAGGPGFAILIGYYSYYSWASYKPPAELWVFDGPLPQGELDRSMTRSVLLGSEWDPITFFEGSTLVVGDLTGDGLDDFISAGDSTFEAPYHVLEMPTPLGEHLLDDIAVARFGGLSSHGAGVVSIGDWNLDTVNDIAFGGKGDADPNGTLDGLEDNLYGAEVLLGPPTGAPDLGDIPADGAVAWYNLFDPDVDGGPDEIGLYSTLIPDVTGDGAADLLVNGELHGIEDDPKTDSFVLFAGNVTGGCDATTAIAELHVPCEPWLFESPTSSGDLTGDGRPDLVLVGRKAHGEGLDMYGAIWVISQLEALASSPPDFPLSLTSVSDAVLQGHSGEALAGTAGLDLNQDGQQDLAVLTEDHLYLFLGPLLGTHDINEADLVVLGAGTIYGDGDLAAGDLTGDGIPEIVVGDPQAAGYLGQVRVYSGAALLSALP